MAAINLPQIASRQTLGPLSIRLPSPPKTSDMASLTQYLAQLRQALEHQVNTQLTTLTTALDDRMGFRGPIKMYSKIDLQYNPIEQVGIAEYPNIPTSAPQFALTLGRPALDQPWEAQAQRITQGIEAQDERDFVILAQVKALLHEALTSAGVGIVPTGAIVMWNGTLATIPSGWHACDGTNGTPDLRDKFVVGARQDDAGVAKTQVTGALTQTGGSISYTPAGTLSLESAGTPAGTISSDSAGTPAGTISSVSAGTPAGTLSSDSAGTPAGSLSSDSAGTPAGTISAIAATATAPLTTLPGAGQNTADNTHTHPAPTFTGSALAGHTHTFTGSALGTHTHTFTGSALGTHTHTFTGSALAGHSHTFTGSALGTHTHTFTGTAAQIIPPYYALVFIMKL